MRDWRPSAAESLRLPYARSAILSSQGTSMATTQSATSTLPAALYAHTKGEKWGLAILAWERGPCRGYQFEDGVLRIFKEGFYEMLEEVDAPADKAARVIAELRRKLGDASPPPHEGGARPRTAAPGLSFEEQVHGFRSRFPEGFADPAWIARYRGRPGGWRRAKGHVDAAFVDARGVLALDELDRALTEDRATEIVTATSAILERTSLLNGAQTEPLRTLPPARHATFGQALRDLIHGEEAYELRFERFVASLSVPRRPGPTWQLATILPALYWPDDHVCVRPTTFREQARWMAPRLVLPSAPSGPLYVRLVEMARAVKTLLEQERLAPRDLMDVYQFMVTSLAPAARRQPAN
jgi:hypothetical protein